MTTQSKRRKLWNISILAALQIFQPVSAIQQGVDYNQGNSNSNFLQPHNKAITLFGQSGSCFCLNGGTCATNTAGTVYCVCVNYYSGTQCEIAPPCSQSPNYCQNNSLCTNTNTASVTNNKVCDCSGTSSSGNTVSGTIVDQYYGTTCEFAPPCDSDPCGISSVGNHGNTCTNNYGTDYRSATYVCTCDSHWTDKNDPGSASPLACDLYWEICKVDADCNTISATFNDPNANSCLTVAHSSGLGTLVENECSCGQYYYGNRCQFKNPCHANLAPNTDLTNPCQNSGTCVPTVGTDQYTCSCKTGYWGTNCQNINPCVSGTDLCSDWSTCVIGKDAAYTCTCDASPAGFPVVTHQFCHRLCSNYYLNKCQNSATCVDPNDPITQMPTCDCATLNANTPGKFYSGDFCEIEVCDNNNCQNGSTCQSTSTTTYQCICPNQFYTGTFCETLPPCDTLTSSQTCLNGSTCRNVKDAITGVVSHTCDCIQQWFGNRCESHNLMCVAPTDPSVVCNGGICSSTVDPTTFAVTRSCDCTKINGVTLTRVDDQPTGAFCQNKPACDSNPCQNNAVCTNDLNAIGGYTCNCLIAGKLYYGKNCETDPPCDSVTCLNGSTCENPPAGTTGVITHNCKCINNFFGSLCQFSKDPCIVDQITGFSVTCNGGVCSEITTAAGNIVPSCDCSTINGNSIANVNDRPTGNFCEIPPPCDATPCKNNAVCTNDPTATGGYTCDCFIAATGKLYYGKDCEIDPPCDSVTCLNGSTCENPPAGTTGTITHNCICINDFFGKFCQFSTLRCVVDQVTGFSTTCNNGLCTEITNNAGNIVPQCDCSTIAGTFISNPLDRPTGDFCEIPPPCDANPCQNNAVCTNDPAATGGYTCNCLIAATGKLYYGKDCEIDPPCDTDPCLNGSTCENPPAGSLGAQIVHKCNCINNFFGTLCQFSTQSCVTDSNTGHSITCNGGICSEITNSAGNIVPSCDCSTIQEIFIANVNDRPTGDYCEVPPPCDANPCKNGSVCTNDPNATGGYTCNCLVGNVRYYGVNCEILPPCDRITGTNQECLHGSTCENIHDPQTNTGSHRCVCIQQWTGVRCENNPVKCEDPNPGETGSTTCNGGICSTQVQADFTVLISCDCSTINDVFISNINDRPTGQFCQIDPPCTRNQGTSLECQNGSTCVNDPTNTDGGYECNCNEQPGGLFYYGRHCEIPKPCNGNINPCNTEDPTAQCNDVDENNDGILEAKCTCTNAFDYYGPICLMKGCKKNPNICTSNGVCVNMDTDEFRCDCIGDWYSSDAANNNFCDLIPNCQHPTLFEIACNWPNGECQNIIDPSTNKAYTDLTTYNCICKNFYEGNRCELPPLCSVPATNPCFDPTTCQDIINDATPEQDYQCNCNPESFRSGKNCENLPCDSQSCLPDSTLTCENTSVSTYVCNCKDNYHGQFCQIKLPCALDENLNRCGDHGTCINVDNDNDGIYESAECECNANYEGEFCEIKKQFPCDENNCKLIGTLQCENTGQGVNDFRCVCKTDEGYSGDQCEIYTPCYNYCQNNQPCSNTEQNPINTDGNTCLCDPSKYYGDRCEFTSFACLPNVEVAGFPEKVSPTCNSKGTCTLDENDPANSHVCKCYNDWTGANCEIPPATDPGDIPGGGTGNTGGTLDSGGTGNTVNKGKKDDKDKYVDGDHIEAHEDFMESYFLDADGQRHSANFIVGVVLGSIGGIAILLWLSWLCYSYFFMGSYNL